MARTKLAYEHLGLKYRPPAQQGDEGLFDPS